MDSQANVIRQHIEGKREELVKNVNELERRVRVATDWKGWFRQRPGLFVGAAFGGGLLLAALGRKHNHNHAGACCRPE